MALTHACVLVFWWQRLLGNHPVAQSALGPVGGGSWSFSGFDPLLLCGDGGILRCVNGLLGVFLLARSTSWLFGGATSTLLQLELLLLFKNKI